MKPRSSWLVPASLALCAMFVVGSMAWITRGTLAAERERAMAEIRADVQERTRLALWRMDSLGAAILLDESLYPDAPSRLPATLRFRISSTGEIHTTGNTDALRKEFAGHGGSLPAMRSITREPEPPPVPAPEIQQQLDQQNTYSSLNRLKQEGQAAANWSENASRSKAVQSTLQANENIANLRMPSASIGSSPAKAAMADEAGPQSAESTGPAAPELLTAQPRVRWLGPMLLLARRIRTQGSDTLFDGAWIDHGSLAAMLLAETSDLLPSASLLPASDPGNDGMVLASFPFRLQVPHLPPLSLVISDSTRYSLITSWAAALVALSAIFCLMRGIMRLSERRASFVSAVTHELRTPLTTFRLYADMLETGAVKEERRSEYLSVLTREADRLTHLVENVLAFSRIERGSARAKVRVMPVADMLDQMRPRLESHLAAAGLHLAIDTPDGLALRADQVAVEHILFNLIDNAAKYATAGDPPVVTITAAGDRKSIRLRVCDHGPGIPAKELRRIFRAFHKSARDAAESKPGVGLGLALSRRLARQQGGDLRCLPREQGACFELRLPAATES